MKITKVKFKSSAQPVIGVRGGMAYISIGDDCDNAWGGGKVTSLEYDRATHSLAIRKGKPFERVAPTERGGMQTFDAALVAWDNVDNACAVDEPQGQQRGK